MVSLPWLILIAFAFQTNLLLVKSLPQFKAGKQIIIYI